MGRGGGPSLRERAIEQVKHVHRITIKKQVTSPYRCPKCFHPDQFGIIRVRDAHKKVIPHLFFGRCYNVECGFSTKPVKAYGTIDAYCVICDQIHREQESTISRKV